MIDRADENRVVAALLKTDLVITPFFFAEQHLLSVAATALDLDADVFDRFEIDDNFLTRSGPNDIGDAVLTGHAGDSGGTLALGELDPLDGLTNRLTRTEQQKHHCHQRKANYCFLHSSIHPFWK